MNAIKYASLVGKYIRMSRPATEEELKIPLQGPTVGMECLCVAVRDYSGPGMGVEVIADYGYAFSILPKDEQHWEFEIWESEEAAKGIRR